MELTDIRPYIALTLTNGVGTVLARNLIAHCGSAEAVFNEKKAVLLKVPGVGRAVADALLGKESFSRADAEIHFMQKRAVSGIHFLNPAFPRRLKHCPDAPLLLYYKGTASLNPKRALAIVGTRKATSYGRQITETLIEGLQGTDILVVSGLAYGIDVIAHRACVKYGIETIGVTAHGHDQIYPPAHAGIAVRMMEHGGVITEFPSRTKPDKQNFPKRNRIVAGMVDALVVVETTVDGGAVITSTLANGYNRDVFAFPGNVLSPFSQGCNQLIRTNRAALVENVQDILSAMQWDADKEKEARQSSLFIALSDAEKAVMELLAEKGELLVDDIAGLLGFTQSKLAGVLLNLELQGLLISMPGKKYAAG
ncbi:MAG: DNA-processing protein DprA [Chitinophagales bacterium]